MDGSASPTRNNGPTRRSQLHDVGLYGGWEGRCSSERTLGTQVNSGLLDPRCPSGPHRFIGAGECHLRVDV